MGTNIEINVKAPIDTVIKTIAEYVNSEKNLSADAYQTAQYCLLDTIGCGIMALKFPECTKMLGPVVTGTIVPHGARVPGTSFVLDPIKAAWDIGCIIRWLDFNDTWLAAEWGHPSDNLGAIFALTDYQSRLRRANGHTPLVVKDILTAMIQAHEIQGVLAIKNSFNRVGLDHVLLVRIASAAVSAKLMGASQSEVEAVVAHAFIDGSALRTYRHTPNTMSRKSWAAGDASSRGLNLARIILKGEGSVQSALTAKTWGFQDVLFKGNPIVLDQQLASYVMEHVLFKISFPAEFHAQTAVEAAITLHAEVMSKLNEIDIIRIDTHESAIRIISKSGELNNPADRDHCLQYMVACGLLFGNLTAEHYENHFAAAHPLIDVLRSKMQVSENSQYTKDYLDPTKRSIANALQIFYKDGSSSKNIAVEYPIGHKLRRKEGIPVLLAKFKKAIESHYGAKQSKRILLACEDTKSLSTMPVDQFMDLFIL
ncbi:MAG: bifunctional 2-methylcitrate dehydratase/aconitate hydratase [Methylacidiphilales bacterium]|nr:bifunctional 2-methylcitrate dehydratase/aconitate hydratase [Candidatus Methylacidiphilales bacterium]